MERTTSFCRCDIIPSSPRSFLISFQTPSEYLSLMDNICRQIFEINFRFFLGIPWMVADFVSEPGLGRRHSIPPKLDKLSFLQYIFETWTLNTKLGKQLNYSITKQPTKRNQYRQTFKSYTLCFFVRLNTEMNPRIKSIISVVLKISKAKFFCRLPNCED